MTSNPLLFLSLVTVLSAGLPAAVQGAGVLTAGCVPPPIEFIAERQFGGFNDGVNPPYAPGQTFKPTAAGVLSEIRLGLYSTVHGDTARVLAEVRSVAAGFPTNAILAQAWVAGAPYVAGNLYTADFAGQPILLSAAATYAITLRSSGPAIVYILGRFPGCAPATGTVSPVHTYDGGATRAYAYTPAERSFVYEVYVDTATPVARSTWGRLKTLYR